MSPSCGSFAARSGLTARRLLNALQGNGFKRDNLARNFRAIEPMRRA
jgi:hypothetical protein